MDAGSFMSKVKFSSLIATGILLAMPWHAQAQGKSNADARMEVSHDVQHDLSPRLGDMSSPAFVHTFHEKPLHLIPRGQTLHQNDPVVQSSASSNVATTAGLNFAGVGN